MNDKMNNEVKGTVLWQLIGGTCAILTIIFMFVAFIELHDANQYKSAYEQELQQHLEDTEKIHELNIRIEGIKEGIKHGCEAQTK